MDGGAVGELRRNCAELRRIAPNGAELRRIAPNCARRAFPHSEYFDDSNSRREARSDAWSFTTSFDSSRSSIGRIVAFSFAIGSSIRSTRPRVQKSAPDTGGMLT